jgi:hypothetical protein
MSRIVIKNSISFEHPAERLDHYVVLGEDSPAKPIFRLYLGSHADETVNFREAHDR